MSNLSLEDVAKVLSEREHLGCLDWYVVKLNGDEDVVCGVGVEEYLSATEARAIAAELEADA